MQSKKPKPKATVDPILKSALTINRANFIKTNDGRFKDKYQLDYLIGRGAISEVYKCNKGDTACKNYGGPSPHSPFELDDNDIHFLNLNESCSGDDDERRD